MAKKLKLVNLEESFIRTPGSMIINNMTDADGRTIADYVKNVLTDINSEIGFAASCECGEFIGNAYEGHVCSHCGTVVSSQFTANLSNTQWLSLPESMPPMLHPMFFCILKDWLGKTTIDKYTKGTKVPLIQIMLDPSVEVPLNLRHIIRGQGFDYFYENHKEILEYFFKNAEKGKSARSNGIKVMARSVKYIYENNYDMLFTRRIPILHSSLHPIVKEGRMKCINQAASIILPAITDLSTLIYSVNRSINSKKYVMTSLWKVYQQYIEYCEVIITNKLGDKYAHCRRHCVGSRLHNSSRAVIIPITNKHNAEDVYMPFKMVVKSWEHKIRNVLINRMGHSFDDVDIKLLKCMTRFDQEVYDVIMLLIKESGLRGIPILLGRNPTLGHGSILRLIVVKIKKDMNDNTVSISPRICPPMNADFDGDEIYQVFIKELESFHAMKNLHPKECMFSKSSLSVSSMITITEQAILHLNSFVREAHNCPDDVDFELDTAI